MHTLTQTYVHTDTNITHIYGYRYTHKQHRDTHTTYPHTAHRHAHNTDRQIDTLTVGSREIIRTVESANPTARNLERCSPGGTAAKLRQDTSDNIC